VPLGPACRHPIAALPLSLFLSRTSVTAHRAPPRSGLACRSRPRPAALPCSCGMAPPAPNGQGLLPATPSCPPLRQAPSLLHANTPTAPFLFFPLCPEPLSRHCLQKRRRPPTSLPFSLRFLSIHVRARHRLPFVPQSRAPEAKGLASFEDGITATAFTR
jgi:hypothetical protein